MEKLETIILISCFCCLFSEFSGIMQWLAWKLKKIDAYETYVSFGGEAKIAIYKPAKLKPFDCAKCLSFWMGLIVFTMQGEGLMAVYYASICSVLSIYIVRYAK